MMGAKSKWKEGGNEMDVRDFLRQPQKLDLMITNKLAEKEQWKALALGITAKLSPDKVQSSGSQSKMEDAIIKCVDVDREIDECVDRLIAAKREVIEVIEQLNAGEYDILHKRYIQYMPLDEIAIVKDKSYSWITTVHGRGLQNVQKILDEKCNFCD